MILIGGTTLKVEELPMYEMMDYQVESGKPLEIKLKTMAKKPECFAVYLHEDQRSEVTIVDEIVDKLTYYKDDKDLIKHLMGVDEEEGYIEEDLGTVAPEFAAPSKDNDELSDFESEDIFADDTDMFEDKEDNSEGIDEVSEFEEEDVSDFEVEDSEKQVEVEEKQEEEITEETETETEKEEDIPEETEEVTEEEHGEEAQDEEETKTKKPYYEELEDVDTELPDSFLQIPNLGDDTDSLKLQLESKDRIIKQKEGMIKELEQEMEEIYSLQEIQIKEVQDAYNKKMDEVNKVIVDLEKKAKGPQIEEEAIDFLKFHNYSKNFRASLRESFNDNEKMKLGRLNSKYYIFSAGAGDSIYSMLKNMKNFIERNNDAIVIDFTNDPFLSTAFARSVKTINGNKMYSMDLIKKDANLLEMFTTFSKTRVLFSNLYNDIGLLSVDWIDVLKKVDEYAGGKPVILLFNNITSFSVRYTVSKLATIGSLYVFAKCSPLILTTLFGDVKFIPAERVNIVATDYIDVVKNVLNVIADKYQVIPFTKEVDWKKIIK